ncbi:MAG: phage tail protein [Acidobacteria bacterium]|nr:phage tail protein [Acidobacteriota bacterium]
MRKELLRGLRFRLEVNGVTLAGFSDVIVGGATLAARPHEDAQPRRAAKPLQVRRFDDIVFKGGVTDSSELSTWSRSAAAGAIADRTKSVVVVMTNESGADVARYTVKDAWPVKYQASDLKADGNEIAIESLELSNEGIELAN